MMQLYIGNKNYSSWSLRPWLLMKQLGIEFEEVRVVLDGFGPESTFKQTISKLNPTGTVPVLVDGDLRIWESIAIVEYVADAFPELPVWPRECKARALARRACAEMHAGFVALRHHCVMNIELSAPEIGARLLAEQPSVARDLARVVELWEEALRASGGPLLFGQFSAADAFFAPVATRIRSYGLKVSPTAAAYVDRIYALPAMQAWVNDALNEQMWVARSELYRAPSNA